MSSTEEHPINDGSQKKRYPMTPAEKVHSFTIEPKNNQRHQKTLIFYDSEEDAQQRMKIIL